MLRLRQRLKDEGFRVEADTRGERIKFKIREHSLQKIPVIGVFGDREIENDTVTVRRFGNKRPKTMTMDEFISSLKAEVQSRSIYSAEG